MSVCQCGCGQPAPVSPVTSRTRGRVAGQPLRFIQGHGTRVRPTTPPADRFWAKVGTGEPTECWPWQASLNHNGYGQFAITSSRHVLAHRFAYEQLVDDVPDGLQLDHLCRNRQCVNPWHLEPVTPALNLARARRAQPTQGATQP